MFSSRSRSDVATPSIRIPLPMRPLLPLPLLWLLLPLALVMLTGARCAGPSSATTQFWVGAHGELDLPIRTGTDYFGIPFGENRVPPSRDPEGSTYFMVVPADGELSAHGVYSQGSIPRGSVEVTMRRCPGGDVQRCSWESLLPVDVSPGPSAWVNRNRASVRAGDVLVRRWRTGSVPLDGGPAASMNSSIEFRNSAPRRFVAMGFATSTSNRARLVSIWGQSDAAASVLGEAAPPLAGPVRVEAFHAARSTAGVEVTLCVEDGGGVDGACDGLGRAVMQCDLRTSRSCASERCLDGSCSYERGDRLFATASGAVGELAVGVRFGATAGHWQSGISGAARIGAMTSPMRGHLNYVCPNPSFATACTTPAPRAATALAIEGRITQAPRLPLLLVLENDGRPTGLLCAFLPGRSSCQSDARTAFRAGEHPTVVQRSPSGAHAGDFSATILWGPEGR